MPAASSQLQQSPSRWWWVLLVVLTLVIGLLMTPAKWLLGYLPPSDIRFEDALGNLLKGSTRFALSAASDAPRIDLVWRFNLLSPLLLKAGWSTDAEVAGSRISANVARTIGGYQLSSGELQISAELLNQVTPLTFSGPDMTAEGLELKYRGGWKRGAGKLSWPGGPVLFADQGQSVSVPAIYASLSLTDGETPQLELLVLDPNSNELAKVTLADDGMLQAAMKRRMLASNPALSGTGSMDETLISTALPIFALGSS